MWGPRASPRETHYGVGLMFVGRIPKSFLMFPVVPWPWRDHSHILGLPQAQNSYTIRLLTSSIPPPLFKTHRLTHSRPNSYFTDITTNLIYTCSQHTHIHTHKQIAAHDILQTQLTCAWVTESQYTHTRTFQKWCWSWLWESSAAIQTF